MLCLKSTEHHKGSKTILFYVSKKFVQNFTIFKVALKNETKVEVVRLNRNIMTIQGDTIQ